MQTNGRRVERSLGAVAAIVVVTAGLHLAAGIVAPVALALVLVVTVAPVGRWLRAHGWPAWLSTLALLLVLYAVLAVGALTLVVSVARLASLLPTYADETGQLLDAIGDGLARLGVTGDEIASTVANLDPARLVALADSVVGSVASLLTNLVFLLALLFFMGAEAAGYPRRLASLAVDRPNLAAALRAFARGTCRYMLVSTIFGLVVAVVDGLALWALGVPLPVLWALLAFVTNYIPNIGFFIGLVPPMTLGLLDGGPRTMVLVIALYCVINFVIQSLIQPKVVGDSTDLSVTVTFLSLVFWTWVLGPLGAVLAIPLTLLAKALLVDTAPQTRWAAHLLSARPHDTVPARAAAGTGPSAS
ncbi:AI-2E family transporter [Actinocatenispora rupis]|uniref:AI-2E family transporter n=1 Tax=Actinocatenispora rupis TaxID=519421 RepID=A0A8J3J431_9ACTN|nr:AI-2E family transporter [Actinocatenispora rupis]GID15416.1 AI-2E family transporter [Actinocatenispora rupis]